MLDDHLVSDLILLGNRFTQMEVKSARILDDSVALEVGVANLVVQLADDGLLEVREDLRSLVLDDVVFGPSNQDLVCENGEDLLETENPHRLSQNGPYDYPRVVLHVFDVLLADSVLLLCGWRVIVGAALPREGGKRRNGRDHHSGGNRHYVPVIKHAQEHGQDAGHEHVYS